MHKAFFNHADLRASSVKFYNEFTSAERKHDVTVDGQLYHWFLFLIYNKTNGENHKITPQWGFFKNWYADESRDPK